MFRFRSPFHPASVHLHSSFRPKIIRFVLNVTDLIPVVHATHLPAPLTSAVGRGRESSVIKMMPIPVIMTRR